MEYLYGKQTSALSAEALSAHLKSYREILIDLGTGDGRYVQQMAQAYPEKFIIGLDACRENLREVSRRSLPNALYLIANAENLPPELSGLASEITINFPWGSLLSGLLASDSAVLASLHNIAKPGAKLEIRLNSSALLQGGYEPEKAGASIQQNLRCHGFAVGKTQKLDQAALRTYPTTWAKRLGFGRDPHALYLQATCPGFVSLTATGVLTLIT